MTGLYISGAHYSSLKNQFQYMTAADKFTVENFCHPVP